MANMSISCYTVQTMARIISVVNQKGGVGKTTTSVNVAAALALLEKRVLLVDIDSQGNATSGLGFDPTSVHPSVYDVLIENSSTDQAIIPTGIEGLDLLPAHVDLAGASVELISVDQREHRLRHALGIVEDRYDFIIIDCPPSLGVLTINGIVAGNEILIPVQAEYYALEGLGQLLRTIELTKEYLHPEMQILGAVLTMYDRRNRLSHAVFEDMYKHFPNTVFRTIIPRTVRLAEAPSYGKPIALYDPTGNGAKAYMKLAREILIREAHINPREVLQQVAEESQLEIPEPDLNYDDPVQAREAILDSVNEFNDTNV